MPGVEIRNLGTTATKAPRIKRAIHRLSTGQSLAVVVDTNRSGGNGDDTTGTAKIHLYLSTGSSRSAFNLHRTYTPAVAIASSTVGAVVSSVVKENNTLYVVYQGTDNSLRIIEFTVTSGSYNAGTEQTVIAASAVTSRFRAVDIDAAPTNANLAVGVYEANASTGQGAWARVYVRLNDNTTWIKAWEHNFLPTQFIRANSEDISIAWNKAGISSNLGQIAVYYTQTHTTGDLGDYLREIQFNVSTGTANSATAVGAWYTNLNANIAAGARRAWLFSEVSGQWVFGSSVGAAVPFFLGMRITHNLFTGLIQNKTSVSVETYRDKYFIMQTNNNAFAYVSADYCDNVLIFGFAALGVTAEYMARAVVIRFSSTTANATALGIDNAARPLDSGYNLADGVIGIYGGCNKNNQAATSDFNFLIFYGATGDSVSATPGTLARKARAVAEDLLSAPIIVGPKNSVVGVGRATLQVSVQHSVPFSLPYGKIEWQLASNSGFSTDLLTIVEGDDRYFSYSATTGTTPPTRILTYILSDAQKLFSRLWYIRARIINDIGGTSNWSTTATFTVSHPPSAMPLSPTPASTLLYGAGTITFSWDRSDTEPTDTQSAYQLIITRLDTGAVVSDSGKVVSSSQSIGVAIASGLKDIPLQWTVSLWDADDKQGPFSSPVLFTLVDPPTVTITSPTSGGTVTTALPTITWSFSVGGTRTQRAFRVRIYHTNPTPDVEVGDSGWVFSTAGSYTFTSQILLEAQNYQVYVYVQDSVGLTDDDNKTFTTDWLDPVALDQSLTYDQFKVMVNWTNANRDTDWIRYRLYRRYQVPDMDEMDVDNTATTWKMILETDEVLSSYTYYDYMMPFNKQVQYAVTQLVDRFGSLLESPISNVDSVTVSGDRYYIVPEEPIGVITSFRTGYVVADSFTREVETNTIHVLGRGRQVQVGDDLGYTGTLTIKLRDPETARADRQFMEYICAKAVKVYLKSPFGDVLYVSFGNISTQRVPGSGSADIVDLTVPYVEVFPEPTIERAGT